MSPDEALDELAAVDEQLEWHERNPLISRVEVYELLLDRRQAAQVAFEVAAADHAKAAR